MPAVMRTRPALSVQCVIPYTSPGFEALWKCKHGLLTTDEARDKLRTLKRAGQNLTKHRALMAMAICRYAIYLEGAFPADWI